MNIRRATGADSDILLECWLKSVRATHTFITEDDICDMMPQVQTYLRSDAELWVACNEDSIIMGFMGMSGSNMDTLFLAPEFHRRGVGQALVRHARTLHGELTLDVNEQNPAARKFYEACGFVVEGRSELDQDGRPFPLLHMRLAQAATATTTS